MDTSHRSIPAVVSGRQGRTTITLNIPEPNTRYFDELVRSKCFPDLLRTGWYPNAKELTESCAAFRAVGKLGLNYQDPNVCVIAVGDGRYPRTAGLFAFRTKWTCIAVDPQAKYHGSLDPGYADMTPRPLVAIHAPEVHRLYSLLGELRSWPEPWSEIYSSMGSPQRVFEHYVFVCVHSHAPMREVTDAIARAPGKSHVVSIRCCHDDSIARMPTEEYYDWGIWSPERRVRIWKNAHHLL